MYIYMLANIITYIIYISLNYCFPDMKLDKLYFRIVHNFIFIKWLMIENSLTVTVKLKRGKRSNFNQRQLFIKKSYDSLILYDHNCCSLHTFIFIFYFSVSPEIRIKKYERYVHPYKMWTQKHKWWTLNSSRFWIVLSIIMA